MIVRDRFTRLGRTASHLGRTDTNRSVVVPPELCRNLPPDIPVSLTILAGLARTNDLAKRHLLHFKVSPELDNPEAIVEALRWIERVFGISPNAPRLVVRHEKGDRPAHYHIVYSIVDPDSGRAIPSEGNYLKDETVSRILELRLGERIVPGTRHDDVVKAVAEMGLDHEAAILRQFEAAKSGARLDAGTRQHAGRTGGDAKAQADCLYGVWVRSAGDAQAFRDGLVNEGYDVVCGDKALVAVPRDGGAPIPVRRAINERSKSAGSPLRLTRATCDDLFESDDSMARRRAQRDSKRLQDAQEATAEELRRLAREALLDGDIPRVSRCYGALAYIAAREQAEARKRVGVALEEIDRESRRLAIIRRRRVDRAFRAAGLFDNAKMKKAIFVIAAGSALLAGGGLGLALVAGGVAVSALPRREYARALARQAQLDRQAAFRRRNDASDAARLQAGNRKTRMLGTRRETLMTGIVFDLARKAKSRSLSFEERKLKRGAEKCLGPKASAVARLLAGRKDAVFVGRQLGLRQPAHYMDRCEVARMFGAAGLGDLADRLDPTSALIRQNLSRSSFPQNEEALPTQHRARELGPELA